MPQINGKFVRLNTTVLDKLLSVLPYRADRLLAETAENITNDIDAHWSQVSPSSPGNPPAVVTEELKRSATIELLPGSERSKIAKQLTYKADHASFTEYGTLNKDGSTRMAPRPWFRPAMLRARQSIVGLFKRIYDVSDLGGGGGV